jgi:hypothetical protein
MKALPASVQRWAIILLPPICLLVACWVVVPRQNKLRDTKKNIESAQKEMAHYVTQLEVIRALPPKPTVATLPMTNPEQSNFLRALTQLCYKTGNKILALDSLAPRQAPKGPTPIGTAAPKKVDTGFPPEITPIKSTIRFEGDFQSLRQFLKALEKSRRLISLTECKIGSADGGFPNLLTSLTITRFVDTPPHLLPKPAAAPNKTS